MKIIEHETVFPRHPFMRPNELKADRIEKLISITRKDGVVAAVTLRESRKVDFYWRKYLVDSQDYHASVDLSQIVSKKSSDLNRQNSKGTRQVNQLRRLQSFKV